MPGPVIGGVLIDIADWRAILFVNLAVAPVAVVFAFRASASSGRSDRAVLDLPGQVASGVALSALASGELNAARQVGGVIGVAVFGALIGRISQHALIAGLHLGGDLRHGPGRRGGGLVGPRTQPV